jgi:alpha-L-arabinofuranosidase
MSTPDKLDTWNVELMQTLRPHLKLIDHLSIHMYWVRGGPETSFSADDYYGLLSEATRTADFILRTAAMLDEDAAGRTSGFALDEWGVAPKRANGGPIRWRPGSRNIRAANTLRDALAAGVMLEAFHRQCTPRRW